MRWSIVRVIWRREMRDQLRDRRTLFMIVVLPLLIYPILGFGVLQFAVGFVNKPSSVGIMGEANLPKLDIPAPTATQAAAWQSIAPAGAGEGVPLVVGALARHQVDEILHGKGYPPLTEIRDDSERFVDHYFEFPRDADTLLVRNISASGEAEGESAEQIGRRLLDAKQIDLLLIVPEEFRERLEHGERPAILIVTRDGDDRSRMVNARVHNVLARWKKRLKEVRLLRSGLSANYDDPFEIENPERARPSTEKMAEGMFELLVKVFPFMLVMWSLAGALYPAVDLCAGEKERGTMETLLITPASREEIVWGKFLTIWVFSAATALLNLVSMGISTWQFSGYLPHDVLKPGPMFLCVLLVLPMSAFFSALCLSVGAYARSSKEGQYYLMPLFLLSMPLIFLTLAPGVELNAFYSMVPITGVALLMQKMMTAPGEQTPWLYFIPVMAPTALYSWLALRWAIEQFKREEVLFREAERLDIGLWLRRLFREKENTPTTGMAVCCFAVVLGLRWLGIGLGPMLSLLRVSGIVLVAFVAAPPILMALILTRRPRESLALRRPSLTTLLTAAALAVLLLPPLMELTSFVLSQFPEMKELMRQNHPFTQALEDLRGSKGVGLLDFLRFAGPYFLVFAVLPALCEEIAFRGFILTGLLRRFKPLTAVLISSFLFALAHLNVFQFIPSLVLGIVLGILAVRSGSILPGMLFHLIHNGLLIGLTYVSGMDGMPETLPATALTTFVIESLCLILAALCLWPLVRRRLPIPSSH
jgi:sodium transport system permease protein